MNALWAHLVSAAEDAERSRSSRVARERRAGAGAHRRPRGGRGRAIGACVPWALVLPCFLAANDGLLDVPGVQVCALLSEAGFELSAAAVEVGTLPLSIVLFKTRRYALRINHNS